MIELFKLDLADYRGLLEKMKGFCGFLENYDKKKLDEAFEKSLEEFWEFRKNCFQTLERRSGQSAELQAAINSQIQNNTVFEIARIRPYLAADTFDELSALAHELQSIMTEILNLDKKIIPKLESELLSVKSELKMIQSAKNIKHAYGQKYNRDARFIDKTE
jgi:hypothetical protein